MLPHLLQHERSSLQCQPINRASAGSERQHLLDNSLSAHESALGTLELSNTSHRNRGLSESQYSDNECRIPSSVVLYPKLLVPRTRSLDHQKGVKSQLHVRAPLDLRPDPASYLECARRNPSRRFGIPSDRTLLGNRHETKRETEPTHRQHSSQRTTAFHRVTSCSSTSFILRTPRSLSATRPTAVSIMERVVSSVQHHSAALPISG